MLEELIFPSFSSSGTIKVEASSKNGSLSKSSIKKKKKNVYSMFTKGKLSRSGES